MRAKEATGGPGIGLRTQCSLCAAWTHPAHCFPQKVKRQTMRAVFHTSRGWAVREGEAAGRKAMCRPIRAPLLTTMVVT